MFGEQRGEQLEVAAPSTKTSLVSNGEASRKAALVQHSPLFSSISALECREIVSVAHERHFIRHQTIFLEGDLVREVVLLTSGSAKVAQLCKDGTEVILRVKGPGEAVGTLGLFPQIRHCSTAQALMASTAIVWDAAAFDSIAHRFIGLRQNITYVLCQQLYDLEERYREISTERVSVRLSHQLVRLLKQIGRRVEGGIEIRLSREELAQLTGTTLFTVSRLLSDWNQRGIVSTRREAVSVSVNNLQALVQLAEE